MTLDELMDLDMRLARMLEHLVPASGLQPPQLQELARAVQQLVAHEIERQAREDARQAQVEHRATPTSFERILDEIDGVDPGGSPDLPDGPTGSA